MARFSQETALPLLLSQGSDPQQGPLPVGV